MGWFCPSFVFRAALSCIKQFTFLWSAKPPGLASDQSNFRSVASSTRFKRTKRLTAGADIPGCAWHNPLGDARSPVAEHPCDFDHSERPPAPSRSPPCDVECVASPGRLARRAAALVPVLTLGTSPRRTRHIRGTSRWPALRREWAAPTSPSRGRLSRLAVVSTWCPSRLRCDTRPV